MQLGAWGGSRSLVCTTWDQNASLLLKLRCHYGSQSLMPCTFCCWPGEYHDHAFHCRPSSYQSLQPFTQISNADELCPQPLRINICHAVPFVETVSSPSVRTALSSCLNPHCHLDNIYHRGLPVAGNVLP